MKAIAKKAKLFDIRQRRPGIFPRVEDIIACASRLSRSFQLLFARWSWWRLPADGTSHRERKVVDEAVVVEQEYFFLGDAVAAGAVGTQAMNRAAEENVLMAVIRRGIALHFQVFAACLRPASLNSSRTARRTAASIRPRRRCSCSASLMSVW